ncbi:MAG: hypothetical protein OEZ20_05865, partial [candidate division WOR-3 bacterium]|nr:hypothetical protein [candidate division WOR-3 bacterium]
LGFGVQAENKFWQVKIPSFRPDVQRDADLIEEIGRVHGYGNLPSRFQLGGKEPGRRDKTSQNLDRIREIMNGGGFNEIYTVSFTDNANAQVFYSKGLITIPNPLNERYSVLRPMLLPTMLEVVNLNLRKGNKDLRLFEIGKVYFDNQGPHESTVLGGIMTGDKFPIHWETKSSLINYFELKAVLETLFKEWQLKDVNFISKAAKFLKSQDATAVRIGDIEFGFLGTLNKEVNQRYEFSQEVYVFELNLEKIGQLMTRLKRFESLPRFPGVVRDFAFVLDQKITVAEIERRIWQAGGERLESVKVFDCFSGGPLAPGKKNLGIRLVLRAPDRTLLEEEANRIFARIVEKLKSEFKVNLRGE